MRNARTVILTSAIWLLAIAGVLALVLTGNLDILNTDSYDSVVVSGRKILPGETITNEDLKMAKVDKGMSSGGALDAPDIVGKVAVGVIHINEQIHPNRISNVEDVKGENYKEYGVLVTTKAFPVVGDVIGRYVDIMVSYNGARRPDVVLSKVPVKYIKTMDGTSVTGDIGLTSAWVYFDLDIESIAFADDAQKVGTIFLARYPFEEMEASKVTYKPSWLGGAEIGE